MKIISVIPARGGSQSIKFKNLAKINNKPLIYYSIKQSLNCKLINRTFVSTDNIKIAKISKHYGAEVPFLRPKKLSSNNSTDYDFLRHIVDWLKNNENYVPDLIVQLRPTQPTRTLDLILQCINKLKKDKKASALRTISEPERTPYKMWVKKGSQLKYLFNNKEKKKEFFNFNRRKLPKVFWHDGLVDIIKTKTILKYKNVTGNKVLFVENKNDYLIDIDEKKDLKLLNVLIKSKLIKINVN